MLMTFFSALAFAGTALGAFALMLVSTLGGGREGERLWTAVLVGLPFAACLLLACGLGVARGGFDWVAPSSRGLQWLLVLGGALASALVMTGGVALGLEPADQIPWALRPVLAIAAWLWPLALVAGTALALWPGLRGGGPAWVWQAPSALVGVVSLLVCTGLLVQVAQEQATRSTEQLARLQSDLTERDRRVMEDVEKSDPVADLVSLMNQTSQFESPPIRERALAKVHAHPDLNTALAEMLRHGWRDYALTYLESNDAPDNAALAGPVREAILGMAGELRERLRGSYVRRDEFEPEVRRILAVADKFTALGGDYHEAVRAVRAVLDEPRGSTTALDCRQALDRWLARHPG